MTYYTDNILYNKGIKQLPHFENLLHTFAMQYKIKVQGNVETVVLLSKGIIDSQKVSKRQIMRVH